MKENDIKTRISQLEEYLRRNSHELKSDSVPDHSFYSYRHSNRLFSSQKGESIRSFTNKIRLQNAAEYLRYSSKTIFDIAIEVGYETSASFSKAFKKAYGISPTVYREKHKETDHSKIPETSNRPYTIEKLNLSDLQCKKILFNLNASDEFFYQLVKSQHDLLFAQQEAFMLLWDEDPYTVQSGESRCFIAFTVASQVQSIDTPPPIEGKYAIFDTSIFSNIEPDDWHRLAFLLLELDQVEMRESTFVEFYAADALDQIKNFLPKRLAISIE